MGDVGDQEGHPDLAAAVDEHGSDAVADTVAEPGYLIMDIAMLRGIKERAERNQAA